LELACNVSALSEQVRKRHFEELVPALLATRKSIRELPDGFEFEFPSDASTLELLSEWATNERLCCSFLQIEVYNARGLWLRLTGNEGVKQFIQAEFAR
jgi:hypothetical protein